MNLGNLRNRINAFLICWFYSANYSAIGALCFFFGTFSWSIGAVLSFSIPMGVPISVTAGGIFLLGIALVGVYITYLSTQHDKEFYILLAGMLAMSLFGFCCITLLEIFYDQISCMLELDLEKKVACQEG